MKTQIRSLEVFEEIASFSDFIVAMSGAEYYVFLRGQWTRQNCKSYLFKSKRVISVIQFMTAFYD